MTKQELIRNPKLMVPICYDEVFKAVFGNREHPEITAYLISMLTGMPYSMLKDHIQFKPTNGNARIKEKQIDKDIIFIVDIAEPLKINLEMNQYEISQSKIDRNLYYGYDEAGSGLEVKGDYSDLKPFIQYNFNMKFVDSVNKEIIDEYFLSNKHGNILSENIKIVHINLEELANMWYSGTYKSYSKQTQKLCALAALMLITKKKKFTDNLKVVPLKEEIKESIERIVWNMNDNEEIVERYYDRDEEYERIKRSYINGERKKARKDGLQEGIKQGILNTAKRLLQNHVDIQIISDATGLSIEEINAIRV